ncbi:MAG TPA: SafA/ExsA family spore coat assembly protein [Bacillota bacterium]|nr:SafA/ExsA family spore coat assembly protein [Bacillota bacterium]HPT66839.1 SafA/ExsA family spore coat assembly protein [Bacillota bacterium]
MSAEYSGLERDVAQSPPLPPGCLNGRIYTVQPGDTMFLIAQRFGISLQRLIEANPQVANPNLIYPGQQLCVPVAAACPPGSTTYTVVQGDTMFEIARRFGVTLDALLAANPQITDPNRIFPGQLVCIPTPVGPPQCPNGFLYTVVRGDTMFEIARRFGITLDALIRANPQIADPNLIFPGQRICVPFPMPPATCSGRFYTIRSGDTLFEIARRAGVSLNALLAANPQIINPDRIFAGQVICIPAAAEAPLPGPSPLPLPSPVPQPEPVPMPPVMPVPTPCPSPYQYMPYYMPYPWQEYPCPPDRKKKKKKHGKRDKCRDRKDKYDYCDDRWRY